MTPIRLFGDPVLRTPATPVVDFDAELRQLVADLTETMFEAGGAGLAAPQIGVGLRVFTWFVDGEVGHQGTQPGVEHGDRLRRGTQHGVAEQPDGAHRHGATIPPAPSCLLAQPVLTDACRRGRLR